MQELDQELRQRLQTIAGVGAETAHQPHPAEIRRRGMRRYRRIAAAATATAMLAAGVGWVASARLLPASEAREAIRPAASTGAAAAPEPKILFGGIFGGAEREAVISVASGKVLRLLSPPPGAQTLGVLSPDRKTWYEPDPASAMRNQCPGSAWRAIDVASGRISKAFGGEADIASVALSPDGRRLALARSRPSASTAGSCEADLAIRDLATGHERRFAVGVSQTPSSLRNGEVQPGGSGEQTPAGKGVGSLAWSLNSTQLAFTLATLKARGPEVHVVTVARMRSIPGRPGAPLARRQLLPDLPTVPRGRTAAGRRTMLGRRRLHRARQRQARRLPAGVRPGQRPAQRGPGAAAGQQRRHLPVGRRLRPARPGAGLPQQPGPRGGEADRLRAARRAAGRGLHRRLRRGVVGRRRGPRTRPGH